MDIVISQINKNWVSILIAIALIALIWIMVRSSNTADSATNAEKFTVVNGKKINMTPSEINENLYEYQEKYLLTNDQFRFLESGGDYTDAEKANLVLRPEYQNQNNRSQTQTTGNPMVGLAVLSFLAVFLIATVVMRIYYPGSFGYGYYPYGYGFGPSLINVQL